MTADVIFWYAGWIVWAMIGAIFTLAAIAAFIFGVGRAYKGGLQWGLVAGLLRMTDEEKQIFHSAAIRLTKTEREAIDALILKNKELLRLMPRGQRLNFDLSGIGGEQWWELSDGTKGRVVSCGGADWLKDDMSFQLRMENDQLIRIRHDGVVEDQPALRVLRQCESPIAKPS